MQAANLTLCSWFKRTRRILFTTVHELPLLFRIAPYERGQDVHKKIKGGGGRDKEEAIPVTGYGGPCGYETLRFLHFSR